MKTKIILALVGCLFIPGKSSFAFIKTCLHGPMGVSAGSFCQELAQRGSPTGGPMAAGSIPDGMSTGSTGGICYSASVTGGKYSYCGGPILSNSSHLGNEWVAARTVLTTLDRLPGVYSMARGEAVGKDLQLARQQYEVHLNRLELIRLDQESQIAKYRQNTLEPAAFAGGKRLEDLIQKIDLTLYPKLAQLTAPATGEIKVDPKPNPIEPVPLPQQSWEQLEDLWRSQQPSSLDEASSNLRGASEEKELAKNYARYFDQQGLLKPDPNQRSVGDPWTKPIELQTLASQVEGRSVREQLNLTLSTYQNALDQNSKEKVLPDVRFSLALAQEADRAFASGKNDLGLSYLNMAGTAISNPRNPALQSGAPVVAYALSQNREVYRQTIRAEEKLASVSTTFEAAALDLVKNYLNESKTSSAQALTLAQQGASRSTVQLLSDFAVDTVTSINSFLGGVAAGVYDGFLSTTLVAQAIYADPTLISHLTNNILYTLSEGPQATGKALYRAFQQVYDVAYHFNFTMTHGTASEKGHAVGTLGAEVLQAFAGGEALQPAKQAIKEVSARVVQRGMMSKDLGVALSKKLVTPETYRSLAPSYRAYFAKAWNYSERYWKGTLGGVEKGAGVPGDAKNIYHYQLLKQALKEAELSSIFEKSGVIKPEHVKDSIKIISGAALGNPMVIAELTKDGSSILDWGKYAYNIKTSSGTYEVHFYFNEKLGTVNPHVDYKIKLSGGQ